VVGVREQVWQAEAVEETEELEDERPLPAAARPAEVVPFSIEARTVAMAAAGGIVAGAATVVVAKAVSKAASPSRRAKRTISGRSKRDDVIASRSFLVDVHLLGR
jgi:IMP dehydrogenase/GMP reductase